MEISNEYPPNFAVIKQILPVTEDTIYCYGETIYNPSGKTIPEDIIFHESIHSKRQKDPEQWWSRYLTDKRFREEEELIAYANQYLLIKRVYPAKFQKQALDELANNFSSLYNLSITQPQAESKIRHKAKLLANL